MMTTAHENNRTIGETVDLLGNLGATLHETVAQATAGGPLATDASTGAILVLRQRDVEHLAYDACLAGVGMTYFDLMGISDGSLRDWYSRIMFTNDGAVHQRLRSIVARAFTPKSVEALRSPAAALSAEAVAVVADDGGDLFAASTSLSTRVMCRLLGVPDADFPMFARWGDALSPVFLMMTPEQIGTATTAIVELLSYLGDLVDHRQSDPGSDLITDLLAAEHEGDRLTRDELLAMVANLLVAGYDTTTSQIGASLLTLLCHPEAAAAVRADPALLASAVSETIRLEPIIPILPRTARTPFQIDGTEIPAGAMVMLCTAAANRDPAAWAQPEQFNPARFAEPGCPRLLTFGAGAHYCLGAALARVTLEELVRAVLAADPPLGLIEEPSAIPWRVILGRTPSRLMVAGGRCDEKSSRPGQEEDR